MSASSEPALDQREEPAQLVAQERLEGDVLAAGERPVERGPGHAGGPGDVVGGGLGDPPPADALQHRRDEALLEGLGGARSGPARRRSPQQASLRQ